MSTDFETAYQHWRRQQEQVARYGQVFVVGCAKSGTTWVGDLLNAHPEVVVRGEGGFTWRLAPMLQSAFQAFNEHQKEMDPITRLRDMDLAMAIRLLIDNQLGRYLSESGKDLSAVRVVGDKTPQHTISMPALQQLYPQAKFIHVIRDPRDTAISAWFHFGPADGRPLEAYVHYYITQVWPLNVGTARRVGPALGGAYLEVRYEDLLTDGPGQLARLLKHIGVDAGADVVSGCLEAASFKKKSGGRAPGQTDNRSFYRTGTSGDWRNHLPAELADRCCAAVAPLMRQVGYEPAAGQMAGV